MPQNNAVSLAGKSSQCLDQGDVINVVAETLSVKCQKQSFNTVLYTVLGLLVQLVHQPGKHVIVLGDIVHDLLVIHLPLQPPGQG